MVANTKFHNEMYQERLAAMYDPAKQVDQLDPEIEELKKKYKKEKKGKFEYTATHKHHNPMGYGSKGF